jgi:hypothetical protein
LSSVRDPTRSMTYFLMPQAYWTLSARSGQEKLSGWADKSAIAVSVGINGLKILFLELRVVRKDLVFRSALSQPPQDLFDGHSVTAHIPPRL